MNIRTVVTLAAAIFLGLIAVILVRGYLHGRGPQGRATALGSETVVVAAKPIQRGASLTPALLKTVSYPIGAAPSGVFHDVGQAAGAGGAPRLALRDLTVNEPVLSSQVSGPGGRLTLSSEMTPGMRAVSLRSNDVAGVGGFVLPGDRVDVLLTRQVGGGDNSYNVTQILAQNVRVLGVDQSDNQNADKPVVTKAVTVEVSPDQAQAISLGQQVGTVSLALRQVADDNAVGRLAMTTADLGFPARPSAPAAPAPGHKGPTRPKLRAGETLIGVTRGVETSSYAVSRF
ncbi:MAG TPA: Flp pilus assembly protein CpaB [Caulobacteraceae bacterium]|nr:Flp pilus assembly protein CpaB [Caulobacteraceae bacterium]